jgi:pimeloyl-ACP methyl ester carboxylesterase
MSHDFILESNKGRKLWSTLFLPKKSKGSLVVMAHGLLGFKDWAFFPFVAEALSGAGFPVLRFNFSGSGMAGKTDGSFTDLTGFENDTITRQVEDLHAVIASAKTGRIPGLPPCGKVMLWGHSRGGGVALLAAAGNPTVSSVAAWAPISRVNRYKMDITSEWRRLGYRLFESNRTGQVLKSSVEFLDDLDKWNRLGDIPSEAFRLKVPVFLLHGQNDTSVSPGESESLAAVIPNARLAILSGADHKFNSRHPFEGPSEPLLEAVDRTIRFFEEVGRDPGSVTKPV